MQILDAKTISIYYVMYYREQKTTCCVRLMIIGLLFLPVLALVLVLAAPAFSQVDATAFNEKFDNFLRTALKEHENELEPVKIPKQGFNIHQSVGLFNITGEATLNDMLLAGLESTRRIGDASLVTLATTDHELKVRLALGILHYQGLSRVLFMGVGPQRKFKGRVVHVEGDLVISLDGIKKQPTLKSLTLHELQGLTFEWDAPNSIFASLSDAVANRVISASLNNLQRTLKFVMQRVLTKVLGNAVVSATDLKNLLQ